MRRRRGAAVATACLVLVLATGCSQQHYEERGKGDGPVAGGKGEDTPAEVYNFPDGFGNLATKCVGKGLRGYATTLSAQSDDNDDVVLLPANQVVVPDPECEGPS